MIIFCVIYLCSVDFVCFQAYTQLATCVGARRTVQPRWCECGHYFQLSFKCFVLSPSRSLYI